MREETILRGGEALAKAVEQAYQQGQTDYYLEPLAQVDGEGQWLLYLFRRKSNGQILEFVMVHGHDNEVQMLHIIPVKVFEIRVYESIGQFDFPLAPPAAENYLVVPTSPTAM